jgi:hypothetical protein
VGDDESEVVAQVAHQAGTVGVVAEQLLALHGEGVDRGGVRGARGELGGHFDRGDLVRQGDVQPLAALGEELPHALGELLRRHVVGPIAHLLARLAREQPVDEGREAVTDRVADHAVLVEGRVHGVDCDSIRALLPAPGC